MLATTDYLGALPAPIAAATDINHIAENTIFPVHRVMVDSGLLAELFMLAAEQQSNLKAVLEIPLPGDKAPVVHTALKYIYAGYPQGLHQSVCPTRTCRKTRAQWLEAEVGYWMWPQMMQRRSSHLLTNMP